MKKLLSITLHSSLLLLTFSLFAGEIHSPYAMNFYTAPEWLPEQVAATNTPGSDSTVEVSVFTNKIVSAWELANDSKLSWSLGTDPYFGTVPQWGGDSWSRTASIFDTQGHDYGSFALQVYGYGDDYPERYDEWAEELGYRMEGVIIAAPTWETVAGPEPVFAHFVRTVSNDVHTVTNVIKHRITLDTESSFYHTLDGWCEREYFTGLGYGETNHNLKTTPLQTIGTNRTIVTQRITGKTNQWNVADRMLSISRNDWHAGFTVEDSPYTHTMQPYWSSQAFDEIYGPQMPEDIYWTSSGLYSLSNKCAVLRGLTNEVVWAGSGTNGWFYTEMFPEDFLFGQTDRYPLPIEPPGHEFGFPRVCAENFEHVVVDSVTNQTLRIERKHQAAVNQAMATLDRTIHSVGSVGAGCGMERRFRRYWEFWSRKYSLEELGFNYDPVEDRYVISTDISVYPEMSTNYWMITTNSWQTSPINSDAIEISSNNVYCTISTDVELGSWELSAGDIVAYLNEHGAYGSTGEVYYVYVRSVAHVSVDSIQMYLACNIPSYTSLPEPVFPCSATNGFVTSGVRILNWYDLREAGRPDFEYMNYMPMDQAWSQNHHGRVADCDDICTASMFIRRYPWDPNVYMHCSVLDRSRQVDFATVHSNEWTRHDFVLRNHILDCCPIDWISPETYVDFNRGSVEGVLQSIKIRGNQSVYFQWRPADNLVYVQMDEGGVWSRVDIPESSLSLSISCIPYQIIIDGDESAHSIPDRDQTEGYCRTRITNVIDWNFNSIRKKTNE